MAASTPKTIILQINDEFRPIYDDLKAHSGSAVKPGHAIAKASATTVEENDTAVPNRPKMVAVEAAWHDGATLSSNVLAIDEAYAVGDTVRYIYPQPGDKLYMWLADSQTAVLDSPLGLNNAGMLTVLTVDASTKAGTIYAFADEAVTTSGAVSRIKVRIA